MHLEIKKPMGLVMEDNHLIKALVFSIFGDDGPVPEVTLLNEKDGVRTYKKENLKEVKGDLDFGALLQIAMKSISLLMGEHVYQDGEQLDEVKYFGILPFPDLKMDGLTYFFLIPDTKARGSARASTFTILVDEKNKNFFYDYWSELRIIITEQANKLDRMMPFDDFSSIVVNLLKELNSFIDQISYPISLKRNVKILFSGLDNSGKTSMILGLEKKYSRLINVRPTQGVARHQTSLMGMTISVWDLAGQQKYRENYVRDAELYLFDCDLLFYLIDVADSNRFDESIAYFSQILDAFRNFEESPPIVVCFHKLDPDSDPALKSHVKDLKQRINKISGDFFIKYFETTVFEPYSLITAFSYGLVMLNPNREIFRLQLEKLANTLGSRSVLLLNEQGMVISDYSRDSESGKVFELSAPHFTILYNYFVDSILKLELGSRSVQYVIDDNVVTFNVIEFDRYKLFLMILHESSEKVSLIEDNIEDFTSKVEDLFKTYY
ncbi:hypothetical protein GF325_04240 [Candidatus Bathyarchaeota archaeon]|nr:hypothetical protein [Candidatus Bathyarchaeota archaeon]